MKKILTLLLATALAATMTACGSSSTPSSSASSAPDAAVSSEVASVEAPTSSAATEPTDISDAETGATVDTSDFPELDGYTKTDMGNGIVSYTNAVGSTIAITFMPADEASLEGFRTKDAAVAAAMDQQMAATASAMAPGTEVAGEFTTVEGKDAYVMNIAIKEPVVMNMTSYVFVIGNNLCSIAGAGMGEEVVADMNKLVNAL